MMNSLKNSSIMLLYFIATFILSFIARTVFLNTLGVEYNGLSSLFSNILSMLSIAELGIGSAIICHLYKPVAEDNIPMIQSLMGFYKKAYYLIALIMFIGSIICLPILPYIVGENTLPINIYVVFLLYALSSVASYLFIYNRSIIVAHQKNYIITICDIGYKIVLNIVQIIILQKTKNYYLYLVIQIVCILLNNIVVTQIAYIKYPYLKDRTKNKLPAEILIDIKQKIKGLLFHKIAGFIVLGTDNILISRLCGLVTVGLYNNYYLIIGTINSVIGQVLGSVTSSIGNLIVTSKKENIFVVYKKMSFLQYVIGTIVGVCIFNVSGPFISIWIGRQYLFSNGILFVILLNNYLQNNRKVINAFKEAAGIYHEDRFIPIIESIINLIFSILFGIKFGLAGIFMGTIASTMILYIYSYPIIVYKRLFDKEIWSYYKEIITHLALYLICFSCSFFLCERLQVASLFLQLIINLGICIITCLGIYYVLFRKTMECQFYISIFSNVIKKLFVRKNIT